MMIRKDTHHLSLYRKLVLFAENVARSHCGHAFSSEDTCFWYHRAWPILRLLDAVSTPYWHIDFYQFAIRQQLARQNIQSPRVLVTGAADFSMAALVNESINSKLATLCVVDQCRTSLEFNRIWADEIGTSMQLIEADILTTTLTGSYDIAVSDALLTRFSRADRPNVLRAIFRSLSPHGVFITTIRDHTRSIDLSGDQRLIQPVGLTERGRSDLSLLGFQEEECASLTDSIKDYCEKMKSTHFDGITELHQMCDVAGLRVDYVESAIVPGEYSETMYLRIIISRKNRSENNV